MVQYLAGVSFPIATPGDFKAAGIAFPVIGLVLLLLRFSTHVFTKARPTVSEALSVLSWLLVAAMGGVLVWNADQGGFGWPTPPGPMLTETYVAPYQELILKGNFYVSWLMALALGTIKLSILFFFRQIFVTQRRNRWDWATRILIVLVTLWTLGMFFNNLFWCGTTFKAFWGPNDLAYACESVGGVAFNQAWTISDLLLDAICLSLPFPIIWRLQLDKRFKVSITGIFLVGIMTIVSNIARIILWAQVLNDEDPDLDVNLAIALMMQWGMIETGLSFFASQLPALATYFHRATHQRMLGSIRSFIHLVSFNKSQLGSVHDMENGESKSYTMDRSGRYESEAASSLRSGCSVQKTVVVETAYQQHPRDFIRSERGNKEMM